MDLHIDGLWCRLWLVPRLVVVPLLVPWLVVPLLLRVVSPALLTGVRLGRGRWRSSIVVGFAHDESRERQVGRLRRVLRKPTSEVLTMIERASSPKRMAASWRRRVLRCLLRRSQNLCKASREREPAAVRNHHTQRIRTQNKHV